MVSRRRGVGSAGSSPLPGPWASSCPGPPFWVPSSVSTVVRHEELRSAGPDASCVTLDFGPLDPPCTAPREGKSGSLSRVPRQGLAGSVRVLPLPGRPGLG